MKANLLAIVATLALAVLATSLVAESQLRRPLTERQQQLDQQLATLRTQVQSRAVMVPQLRTNQWVTETQAELAKLKLRHDQFLQSPFGWPSLWLGRGPFDPTLHVTR